MEKKTFLAVLLSIAVMLIYSSYMQRYYPKEQAVHVPAHTAQQGHIQEGIVPARHHVAASTERFGRTERIASEYLSCEISRNDGSIKSIGILKYNGKLAARPILLSNSQVPNDAIFYMQGLESVGSLSTSAGSLSRASNGLIIQQKIDNKLDVTRRINFHNSLYGIELEIIFKNTSSSAIRDSYSIVGVSNMLMDDLQESRFTEGLIYTGRSAQRFRPGTIKPGGNTYFGPADLIMMKNKYFSMIIKPFQPIQSVTVLPTQQADGAGGTVFSSKALLDSRENILMPGETTSHKYLLYAGPSDISLLSSYEAGLEAPHIGGVFAGLSRLLITTLKMFYKITHNYGVSIIMLTFVIALIMYPLTFKSLKSMKQMQHIQPKVDQLRRDYKDSPQKLNKEIMELYKKHKVNPFGGCLPMFLQLPIFIGLYQGLSRFIGLKGAAFLWIKDLSAPDKAFILPNSFPVIGDSINILPLMMAAAMFLQQKMSAPKTPGPHKNEGHDAMQQQQKMMSIMMPVLFGVLFYKFPSGLVLYWLTNTVIMLVQQAKISKHVHAELTAHS